MRKCCSILLVPVVLLLSAGLWAQSLTATGLQFGPYGTYNQAVGSLTEHEAGNAAAGIDFFYELPFNLPEWIPFSSLGVSAGLDFGSPVYKEEYVDSWYVMNALAGIWFDWNLFSVFKIRPEASYGFAVNFVESKVRNVHGGHTDQIGRFGCNLIWEPVFLRGWSVYGGANYMYMPEQDNLGNYMGIKAGLLYRPDNIYKKQKAAQRLAMIAALQEAERQAELEKERQRQAELEQARLEAERRQKEAMEKASAEELAKLQAEREALEAQLKEAEEKAKAAEEAARLAAEKAAAEKAEAERIIAEEKARLEAEAKAKTVKKVEVQMNEDGSVAIAIPTLSFKSDRAELTDAKSNEETLTKVYEILSNPDYADFKCHITGFVNPDNLIWTESENQLALNRAKTVISKLCEKGLDAERFSSSYGSGKTTNKEYNRRVEFKLTK